MKNTQQWRGGVKQISLVLIKQWTARARARSIFTITPAVNSRSQLHTAFNLQTILDIWANICKAERCGRGKYLGKLPHDRELA